MRLINTAGITFDITYVILLLQVGLGQLYYQGGRGVEINHEVSEKKDIYNISCGTI